MLQLEHSFLYVSKYILKACLDARLLVGIDFQLHTKPPILLFISFSIGALVKSPIQLPPNPKFFYLSNYILKAYARMSDC